MQMDRACRLACTCAVKNACLTLAHDLGPYQTSDLPLGPWGLALPLYGTLSDNRKVRQLDHTP